MMEETAAVPKERESNKARMKSSEKVFRRKLQSVQKTRSFIDALREKYCSPDDIQCDFIIDIVIRGKPTNNGPASAELGHLRNIVLSNCRVSSGGLPENGLSSLCPNVTDLDLSSNLLESWTELLPLLSQLPHLKFLNLSRNHITRHKEELWRWPTPLPKVENVVLNSTGIPLREVLALARLMPLLRELHICCNYYSDLGSIEVAIKEGALEKLDCLRLNENIITSWSEVWKLRNLPCLTQLILSENPLCNVFFDSSGQMVDSCPSEMDSPDITCHSDGEDSSFGSPHFRYLSTKSLIDSCSRNSPATTVLLSNGVHSDCNTQFSNDTSQKLESQEAGAIPCGQPDFVRNLIDNLIYEVCEKISIQESCERCWQNSTQNFNGTVSDNINSSEHIESFHRDDEFPVPPGNSNQNGNCPGFDLEMAGHFADIGDEEEDFSVTNECESCAGKVDLHDWESVQVCERGVQEGNNRGVSPTEEEEEEKSVPFAKLHILCLSQTSICELDHLHALNEFPRLESLRITDIALFSHLHQEDRRKLCVASLPKVKILNGSEVTSTEREKAERHYLRHFMNHEDKSARYRELEAKHGQVKPLFDIDLGARFQKQVTLTFMLQGVEQFNETVKVLQPVGKLRSFIAKKLAIPCNSFRMFHYANGPYQDPADHAIDELFLDSLPMSRFDFMDGDELHIEPLSETSASPVVKFSKKEIKFQSEICSE